MITEFQKAKEKIDQARQILILFTQNVDPDCFGSAFSMYRYLKHLGKKVSVANYHGNIRSYLDKFPIKEDDLVRKKKQIGRFDLYISVDGMEMDRLNVDKDIVKEDMIHFDHHMFSGKTAGLVICDSAKASTTELLYDYLKYVNYEIPAKVADALLIGIITDTHNFQHSNVTPELMRKAADLISISNNVYQISKQYLYRKNLTDLKLLGEGLRRLKFIKDRGLVFSVLTQKTLAKYNAEHKDMSMLSYFLNTTKDAKFSLLLTERKNGQVKGSLRSEKEKGINVGEIAQMFQGGGHLAAAGFKLKGRIQKVSKGRWQVV